MDMALHEFNYEKEKIVNVVKKILEDAILIFATDIHFDPAEDELTIRLRIDGDLVLYTTVPESAMKNIITRIKILAGMNITESSIPQTGFITYKMKDVTHNMRVSSIPVVHGEKIVVHISNHANKFAKLDELNFSEYDLKKIKNLLNNTAGTKLLHYTLWFMNLITIRRIFLLLKIVLKLIWMVLIKYKLTNTRA